MLEMQKSYNPDRLLELSKKYELSLELLIKNYWSGQKRSRLLTPLKSKCNLSVYSHANSRLQTVKLRAIDPQNELFDYALSSEDIFEDSTFTKGLKFSLQLFHTQAKDTLYISSNADHITTAKSLGINTLQSLEFTNEKAISTSIDHKDGGTLAHLKDLNWMIEKL